MRIIISDPNQYPTFLIVRVDQTNDFGAANTEVIQVLQIGGFYENSPSIYFIGTLYYETLVKRWLIDKILSREIWNCREEAEIALMANSYTVIDYSDE